MFLAVAFTFSCKPDSKDETDTNNNAVEDARKDFVGTWSCTETSQIHKTSTFSIEIKLDPSNSSQVMIYNIYHLGTTEYVLATINGTSLSIAEQPVCNNTAKLKGSGSLVSANKLNLSYSYNDTADLDNATAVCTK